MTAYDLAGLELEARSIRESGREAESEGILNAILREDPRHCFALKSLSGLARQRGDFQSAMDLCDRAIDADPDNIWLVFDKAQILRDQSRLDEARGVYHDILVRRPRFHLAYRGLAQVARDQGRPAEALTFFRLALDQSPSDESDRFNVAEMLRVLRRFDEAAAENLRLLADNPGFFHAERELGLIALEKGDLESSIRLLEKVCSQDPSNPWTLSDLARVHYVTGHVERAKVLYEMLVERDGAFAPALIALCHVRLDLADMDDAEGLLARAEEARSEDICIRFDIARAHVRLGRLAEGVALFKNLSANPAYVQALDRQFVDLLSETARKARASGDFAAAAAASREVAWILPDDKMARVDLARDLSRAGDLDAAREAYRPLYRDPERGVATAMECFEALRRCGAWNKASESLSEAIEANPGDPGLLLRKAICLRETGQFDRADLLCDAAAAAGGDVYEVFVQRAMTARARNDDRSAEKLLNSALETDPGRPFAYFELSRLLVGHARFDEARVLLERARGLPGAEAESLLLLAKLEVRAGASVRAAEILDEVLAVDHDNLDALISLAELRRSLGRVNDAEALMARARSVAPGDARVFESAAAQALESGKLVEALAGYRQTARIDPSRLWPRIVVARLTALADDEEEGLSLFRGLLDSFGRNPDVHAVFAEVLEQLGRLDDAVAASDQAMTARPRDAALWRQAALLQLRSGNYAHVEKMLEAATDPREADAISGRLSLARFDYAAARPRLRKASIARPRDQSILTSLAFLALLSCDFPATEALLTSLKDIDGRRPSATHLGNLYDEFRIDADLARRLREALAQAPAPRLELLRSLVLHSPGSTATSLALLVELRRQGFPRPPPGGVSPIPAVVAFSSGRSPARILSARTAAWRKVAPHFDVRAFDDDSAWSEILASGRPDLVQAFRKAADPAMRCDLFRLYHLHAHGGVVVDLDARPRPSFPGLLHNASEIIVLQDEFGAVGHGIVAAVADHFLINRALDEAVVAINRGDHDMAWLCSGPGLLSRTLASCLAERQAEWAEIFAKLHVAPPEEWSGALALGCWTGRST